MPEISSSKKWKMLRVYRCGTRALTERDVATGNGKPTALCDDAVLGGLTETCHLFEGTGGNWSFHFNDLWFLCFWTFTPSLWMRQGIQCIAVRRQCCSLLNGQFGVSSCWRRTRSLRSELIVMTLSGCLSFETDLSYGLWSGAYRMAATTGNCSTSGPDAALFRDDLAGYIGI